MTVFRRLLWRISKRSRRSISLTYTRCFWTDQTAMKPDKEGTIRISPTQPTAAVIFAHGLGDTASGWASTMHKLSRSLPHIQFVLPTAKTQPVTLNMGMKMPSWYDITSFSSREHQEAKGIENSQFRLGRLIEEQVANGIPLHRIVLGGFSQGAALSIFTGLQYPKKLGGVLVLSGYLPKREAFHMSQVSKDIPILMCHGEMDPVVRFEWGKLTKEALESCKARNIQFKAYPYLEHSSSEEEIKDVIDWLQNVLPIE
uniref:palmitoyl-protein hydrolase n=1 Tax=Albugo laibachii Nc14 TaxID=890382 RepID=F0WWR4_9STRA|nr:acylprotein thioesterase putative [Albugo laibachii Nc14]|eukprot:CCA25891.1 acylprotein thioesterase putative [Albugo laibachii Nc14]